MDDALHTAGRPDDADRAGEHRAIDGALRTHPDVPMMQIEQENIEATDDSLRRQPEVPRMQILHENIGPLTTRCAGCRTSR